MPATERSHTHRITALALACAVNALFLSLWLFSRARVSPEAVATAMIWVTTQLPRPSSPAPRPRKEQKSRATSSMRMPVPIVESRAPGRSTAITVPPVDWYAEGALSVSGLFRDEARQRPDPSLDSKPQALVLPDSSNRPHKPGDSEQFEGGVVITWINETCYYRSEPLENMMGDPHKLKLPTCKARSMWEREVEKRAAELEKTAKPDYLSRPLPLPATPEVQAARD
jgi:hypothetical protein